MRRPTLVALFATVVFIPAGFAQDTSAARSPEPGFVATFPPVSIGVPPNSALVPGGRLGSRVPPAVLAAQWQARVLATLPSEFPRGPLPPPPETAPLAAAPVAPAPGVQRALGVLGPYADLGMQLNVRFELKADQFRNLRCTTLEQQVAISGCTSGFPTISPNPQYSIRTAGVVGQRLHVNVDFDSQREFDASNNLQLWYEGLQDEVLRRVEAGNVTFQMPPSRFISAAIPANNFGVQAIGQLGPVEFRGIFAQQKGNVVRDRIYDVGQTTSQPLDRQARDLDYEAGRFFFAVDPSQIPGYPKVDILTLDPTQLPAVLRVSSLHVYRLRALAPGSITNQNLGGVRAVACGPGTRAVDCTAPGAQRAGPFQWEILQEGKDYYVDPTGAWFALANRLDQSDYLAVSYVAATGVDSVGTFPAAASPDTTHVDTLRLVYDPKPSVTAASPTFRFEIRSAYRIGGNDIDRTSVDLSLLVNQRARPTGSGDTYLKRLGLALESDATKLDQYNRLFPRARDPQQGAPLRDYYVIFPHLRPFADTTALVPAERNDSLYKTPRLVLATQGPPSVFTLAIRASTAGSRDRTTLSLNSFQIRDGSERIYVGNTLLQRGADYTIDYATGTVQFSNADSLFQGGATQVRAQFEERAAFAVAPTSIYGLAAKYDLGSLGQVNLTGLFQKQQSTFTRPPLGFEPSSSFIGGLSTELHLQPEAITRIIGAIPGVHTDAPSFLNISGEIAVSRPRPNAFGQAYVEEFESEGGRFVGLAENQWHWGSRPSSARGAGIVGEFVNGDAAALTWQSLPYNNVPGRGLVPIQFLAQQIDPTIRFVGQSQNAEPVLWLMLKPDTVLGLSNNRHNNPDGSLNPLDGSPNWVRPPQNAPRWRSITQTFSATGIDLSRIEYLEFWVWEDNHRTARANGARLLVDLGSTFEDAIAWVPRSFVVSPQGDTTWYGQRFAGLGRLDTERDPRTLTWNAQINDEGILSDRVTGEGGIDDSTPGAARVHYDTLPLCSATEGGRITPYGFGDLRSRCGRHNGFLDTEDQDGDNQLDSATGVKSSETFTRFVFPIGDDRYYVRDGGMTPVDSAGRPNGAAGWRLYRIPFHQDTIEVGSPNLHQVQTIRLTIVAPASAPPEPQIYFGLSRMRFVGSSWLKRADTPIRGIAGELGEPSGQVIASVVSTENRDLGYTPPPGVFDQASRTDASFQLGAQQINERSLRLLASGLAKGQHAEAFTRFTTEGDKNFLKYQKLRVWARGRGPGWEDGDLHFYIKVGKDQNNFYFYHTPARTSSWDPEVVVDFSRWLVLRARIERAWLIGDTAHVYGGCPDSTLVPYDSAYVMCDGPYIVHVRDPGTAPPNLAAVQEMAAGILRVDDKVFVDQAELWVDDIRLSDVVQDVGAAGVLDLTLTAADVADLAVSVSRRDGQFRQLGEDPNYVTDNAASVSGTIRLDKFLPGSWGLSAPLAIRYGTTTSAPFYLAGTDLRADALQGLRTPRSSVTSYALSLRHVRRSSSSLGRLLLDPLGVSGSYSSGGQRSSLADAQASAYAASVDWAVNPAPRQWRRFRLTPTSLRFHSGFSGTNASRFDFTVPVVRAADSTLAPARSNTKYWVNSGGLDLLPLSGVQMHVDLTSTRDLRDYGDSTTLGRVTRGARRTLFGQDVGIEVQRSLGTIVSITPRVGPWLRPRLALSSSFSLARDPNASRAVRDVGDTAGGFHLPVSFANSRRLDLGTQVDPRRLGRAIFGDSAAFARLFGRISNLDLTYNWSLHSVFTAAAFSPGLGYQLALGGLSSFRSVAGLLAVSAVQTSNLTGATGLNLPLGLHATTTYGRSEAISWVRRSDQQVPIQSRSRDWPAATFSWNFTPPQRTIGRLLAALAAQVSIRRRLTSSTQPGFGTSATAIQSSTTDQSVAPSVTLTWLKGILTSFDASSQKTDQLSAGSLSHSQRASQNATLTFAFRSPARRLKSDIRTTLHYSALATTTCLKN
ncbi:MAG TPA: cell surface protein SprA, partial [Gemmatimonadales bacterium]|nr:cell surface protein SprA [Gemmatimonadales bacterium]